MGISRFSRLPRAGSGRRLLATTFGMMLAAALPIPATHNTARAEAAHDAVLAAIANTKGTFLVYNFGGGNPAPFRNAAGNEYTLDNGGHLMVIKSASSRLRANLLVDTHSGYQSRCESDARARTAEGLWQASETYKPMAAWTTMGKPTFIINANFFDVRGQKGGNWKSTGCTSPLGAYVDTANGSANYNKQVTGTRVYAGKQALSGGDEVWTALATMVFSPGSAPEVIASAGPKDYGYATGPLEGLMDKGVQFVAVSGLKLLLPGFTEQLNDPGPAAARTALGYKSATDELMVFQGGSYTPDNLQDLYRGLGVDKAIALDGGSSSAIVLRRDAGGMWAGYGSPKGNCDTTYTLCDAAGGVGRALPSWLGFS
ncbi:phosphodiester glycosidase family protein [Mycobacteroides salmoniphilum]|uniref:Phosphodiester glycosidase domain-containing protein n=1 Tax=Mycobacteroides salmoniphilum TaxID=404941 RepID=A0A4V3I178_9MYCO|nr:phosphodiester glycosidase family protein [Mycobacteroides salmoniphilum]TDZ99124.1 hypothetical protein CCUG62472_00362 [Mycobacteroides salmoniphilum]TEA06481.1 hypothetical protein CCUG60884_01619 [Mycobacteroides salmoniphilum]